MLSVPETLIRVNKKFSEFKVLTIARKLSQITDLDNYDFDSDFNTNSENAECMIVGSGDLGTGLYTRNDPPTWNDFEQYATVCQVIEDPIKSSISGDFCFCSGNQSQNAGQTNYYFDCQQMAVANLPQFDYSRIHAPNDGYVWAFDVWLTPFKPYTFALFQWNSATYFQWYGGGKLIQPSFVDGGSLPGDEPILSGDDTFLRIRETGVRYYAGPVPQQVGWNAVDPSNIKIVPAVMDNKIALNINWYMTTNNTNMMMGHNLACSNTYRDDTTISGGTLQDDILYEGILKKYYGENEGVEGETEEPHFEEDTMICVYRECSINDLINDTSINYNGSNTNWENTSENLIDWIFEHISISNVLSANYISNGKFLKTIDEEYSENADSYTDINGILTNISAWDNYTMIVPKQQNFTPDPQISPSPRLPWGSSGYIYPTSGVNETQSVYFNYAHGVPYYLNSNPLQYGLGGLFVEYNRSGSYSNTDAQTSFETEFDDTWGNEWCNEMIPFKFSDDDKVRFYTFYVDEECTSPITIYTYYNKHLSENTNNYPTDYYGFDGASPFIIGVMGKGANSPIGISSNDMYKNDGSWRTFTAPSTWSDNDTPLQQSKNLFMCGNIENDKVTEMCIFMCKCEIPTYITGVGTKEYYNGVLLYTPNLEWKYDISTFRQAKSITCIIPYSGTKVEDPIEKGNNGNIPRSNPEENAGAGCDDKSPESLGTNRTHIEPDKPLPPMSTNIFASGLLSLYTIDNANLTKLGGDLFSNNIFEQIEHGVQKPIDCILRIAESRISPITESTPRAIKLGSATLSAFGNRATKTYKTVNCGEVLIQRINGDYTDNDEKIMVYLPYIGFKQLDGNILQNTKLKLEYIFNFLNGTCIANLQWTPVAGNPVYENAKGKWAYLTSFTGEFITTFPIGTSSNTGLLSTLMSAGLGVMTHNAYYARASIRSLPNSFYPTFEHTGEFGANCSNMINRLQPYIYKFSLRHSFPHNSIGKVTIENSSGKINGLFTSKYITISKDIYKRDGTKNGYILCDNFEFKNTPTSITADECEMLKNLFNEGVWAE